MPSDNLGTIMVDASDSGSGATANLTQTGTFEVLGTNLPSVSDDNEFSIAFTNTIQALENFDVTVKSDYWDTGTFTADIMYEIILETTDASVGIENGWSLQPNAGFYYEYSLGDYYNYDEIQSSLAPGNYTLVLDPWGIGDGEVNARYLFSLSTTYVPDVAVLSADGSTPDTTDQFFVDGGWEKNSSSAGYEAAESALPPGQTDTVLLGGYIIQGGTITETISSGSIPLSGEIGTIGVNSDGPWDISGQSTIDALEVNSGILDIDAGSTVTVQDLYSAQGAAIDLRGALIADIPAVTIDGPLFVLQTGTLFDETDIHAETVAVSGTISLSVGSVLQAGSVDISPSGLIIGSGLVSATLSNDGTISSTGTLELDGSISGIGSLIVQAGSNELILNGSIASTQVISFAGTAGLSGDGGTLIVEGSPTLAATIDNFLYGDTIDLAGLTFDPNGTLSPHLDGSTGTLTIDQGALGATGSQVASLVLENYNTSNTFQFVPDGSGGTDVLVAAPPPTLSDLADMSKFTYSEDSYSGQKGDVVSTYTLMSGMSDAFGLLADVFSNANQVVIAFRGTDSGHIYNFAENLLSDASWLVGSPSTELITEVQDAASFLYQVRNQIGTATPNAAITLTGHSLGGAIAQLLGSASSYTTVAFNAPGAQQFFGPLSPQLSPARQAAANGDDGGAMPDLNFRVAGDQVSLTGTSIGTQWTLPSPYTDNWLDWLNNHSANTVTFVLSKWGGESSTAFSQAGLGQTSEDAPLSRADLIDPVLGLLNTEASQFVYSMSFKIAVAASVGLASGAYLSELLMIDPPSASAYQLVGDSSSPQFSAIAFQAYPGVAYYQVALDVGGTWQGNQTVDVGTVLGVPADTTGVRYSAFDVNGDPVNLPDGFPDIVAAFATTGTFNGVLTETLASESGVTCFAAGTRILTEAGEVPVERLVMGDKVITYSGPARAIRWVGYRRIDCCKHPQPRRAWPIAIRANAFSRGIPKRTLLLSPQHSVFVEGVLIPIRCLVNGSSVAVSEVEMIEYYHIELDEHDVIFADGLPTETYLDVGDRSNFSNGGPSVALYPDMCSLTWDARGYAPIKMVGTEVETVRGRLSQRARLRASRARTSPNKRRAG